MCSGLVLTTTKKKSDPFGSWSCLAFLRASRTTYISSNGGQAWKKSIHVINAIHLLHLPSSSVNSSVSNLNNRSSLRRPYLHLIGFHGGLHLRSGDISNGGENHRCWSWELSGENRRSTVSTSGRWIGSRMSSDNSSSSLWVCDSCLRYLRLSLPVWDEWSWTDGYNLYVQWALFIFRIANSSFDYWSFRRKQKRMESYCNRSFYTR